MSDESHSVMQHAALASGLLSQQQLDDAMAGLTAASPGAPVAAAQVTDEMLGQRLVELGYLNRWQVEQLKDGRTKFTLGPYRIVNAIGQGGMGHVFKAEHKLLGRVEAIKVLPKSRSTPEAVAAFQREIRAHAQLDHPNLVRVSYADFEGDAFFLVTEYVPGTDLRKLVRRNGPLPYAIAATIVAQAAEGLHYAHRKGMVHRDVKPGNLLVTPEGHTKVTDLGLAWFFLDDFDMPGGPRGNTLVGTADYMAPESILEPDKVRPISDVYSLGCTLYYAVTGKVPFPGGNTAEKMRRHLEEAPLNPLHFNPDLPEAFCDVIATMMEKNADKRTPTAEAVVELLRPWCDERATQHLAESAPPPSGIYVRGAGGPPAGITPTLSETASFVLDDMEGGPSLTESPSQISQGTSSIAAASEETRPHPRTAHRSATVKVEPPPVAQKSSWKIAAVVLVVAAIAALAAWLAGAF